MKFNYLRLDSKKYRKKFIRLILALIISGLLPLSCVTSKKIKDGRTAFQQKQYAVAIDYLLKDVSTKEGTDEYPEIAYLLGESYKNLNESEPSLNWYIEAAKNNYGPEAFWEMSYALKKNERYEDAILSFQRLAKMTGREKEIRIEIEKCRQAQRWQQLDNNNNYIVEALLLNSTESDYAPALWNGRNIVFTSDRANGNDETYAWTGNAFSDLYVSDIDNYHPIPFDEKVNTIHNEGTATFSRDGQIMYFTRCHSESGPAYCKIYRSEYTQGRWGKEELAFAPKRNVNYTDPVLIEKDSVLIFVSDDPTGFGGEDLYNSLLLEDGSWSQPDLMPPYLNSTGQERFPTWHEPTQTLYYSSDHFTSLGGLDIFKTSLRDDGSWTKPENMLEPFNSSEDDYGLVYVEEQHLAESLKMKAFFTSTRGVYGNDDIYSIVEEYPVDYVPPVDSVTEEIEIVKEEEKKSFYLRIQVKENLYAISNNPNSYVVGTKNVDGSSVKISGETVSELLETDSKGVVIIPMDSSMNFEILAGKQGYLNNLELFTISESDKDEKPDRYVFEKSIIIDKVFEGVEIVMDNIYYDLDKDFIREDAKPALDQLIEILEANPKLKIELASHTDCQGEDTYNLDLSDRRAASAVRYILSQSEVNEQRLSSVGYGESKFEIDCECDNCTEEEHQINRRTTFKINR